MDYFTAHLHAREAHEHLLRAHYNRKSPDWPASVALENLRDCAAILGFDLIAKSAGHTSMYKALKQIVADRDETESEFAGMPTQIRNSSIENARALVKAYEKTQSVSTQETMTAAGPSPGPAAVPSQEHRAAVEAGYAPLSGYVAPPDFDSRAHKPMDTDGFAMKDADK